MFHSGKLVPGEEEATFYIRCSGFLGREETNTRCVFVFVCCCACFCFVLMELCGPDQKIPTNTVLEKSNESAEKKN